MCPMYAPAREESVGSLGAEVRVAVGHMMWVLGTEFRSSQRIASARSHWAFPSEPSLWPLKHILFSLETGPHVVSLAGFKLTEIRLLLPPRCWGSRHEPLHLVFKCSFGEKLSPKAWIHLVSCCYAFYPSSSTLFWAFSGFQSLGSWTETLAFCITRKPTDKSTAATSVFSRSLRVTSRRTWLQCSLREPCLLWGRDVELPRQMVNCRNHKAKIAREAGTSGIASSCVGGWGRQRPRPRLSWAT